MSKFFKVLIILVLIFLGVYGGYRIYLFYSEKNGTDLSVDINKFNENLATEVFREDLKSSINFVGNTKIKNQQKLKFNYENRVTGVYKKVNDNVKKGDLIAELDKREIYSQIEIYKLNVQNAQLKLKKLLEDTSEVEIKKSQIGLDKLKEELQNAKDNLSFFKKEQESKLTDMKKNLRNKETEYRILQAETKVSLSQLSLSPEEKEQELLKSKNSLSTMQTEYERLKRDFEVNLSKKETEYYSVIEKEYLSIEESLRSLGKTFTDLDVLLNALPNSNLNNSYLIYFSAKNSSYKNQAINSFLGGHAYFKILEKEVEGLKEKRNIDKLIQLFAIQLKMYEDLTITGENIMKGLENSIETNEFTSSDISSFYSQASSLYSSSNSRILELKKLPMELKTLKKPIEIKEDMENEIKTKKDQIEDLKITIQKIEDDVGLVSDVSSHKVEQENKKLSDKLKEIEDYKRDLEKTKMNNAFELNSKQKSIKETELQIIEAERNLKDLLDDSSNKELIFAQNELKQAKISLENEIKKLEQYELKAPFDGIITKIDYQPGDNLTQNDEKYILLENPDILEISIFADQVDVMKLSKGQKALVSYDAFPGVVFEAHIIDIDSTPQEKDGVTKYEVKIYLEKPEETIFSGMNAQVNIIIQEKLGVLSVPFSSVNTDIETGESYVVVLKPNGEKERKNIVIGYSDGIKTEILEGLDEGDKVLGIDYDSNYYKAEDFGADSGYYY